MARITGDYERRTVGGEEVAAFVPRPLPPADPPLAVKGRLASLLGHAEQELGRLDLAGEMVPSIGWFLYAFVRKEAVISSQIEGTQASLVDLLRFEAGAQPESGTRAEVQEVCNHLYTRGPADVPAPEDASGRKRQAFRRS
jgi:hypothetical protein